MDIDGFKAVVSVRTAMLLVRATSATKDLCQSNVMESVIEVEGNLAMFTCQDYAGYRPLICLSRRFAAIALHILYPVACWELLLCRSVKFWGWFASMLSCSLRCLWMSPVHFFQRLAFRLEMKGVCGECKCGGRKIVWWWWWG